MQPTHYDLLGIKPAATAEEIRRAYRKHAAKLHPDKNPAPDAQQKFAALAAAYETLSDKSRRRAYDASLERARRPKREPDDDEPIVGSPAHYTWMNIATESSDPASPARGRNGRAAAPRKNQARTTELDEMYDAFFGSARPAPRPGKSPRAPSSG